MDRLRRIEGQILGFQRLIAEGTRCVEVLIRVSAVPSAMKKTGAAIISAHMKTCVGMKPRRIRGRGGTILWLP